MEGSVEVSRSMMGGTECPILKGLCGAVAGAVG